jgi:hypothetical protein
MAPQFRVRTDEPSNALLDRQMPEILYEFVENVEMDDPRTRVC